MNDMGNKPFGAGLYTAVEQYVQVLRTQEQKTGEEEKTQLTEEKRRKKEQQENLRALRRQLTNLAVATTKPPIATTLTDILRRHGHVSLELGKVEFSDNGSSVDYGIYLNRGKISFYQGGHHCSGPRDFVSGVTEDDLKKPLTPQQYECDLRSTIKKATSELRRRKKPREMDRDDAA